MLERNHPLLSIRKQAILLDVCRSNLYYKPLLTNESSLANLIKEIYLQSDCRYGYRKITAALNQQGQIINHKKVLRLMQKMTIQGLYPRKFKATSLKGAHKIYPYLLQGLEISYPDHVWATDIVITGYKMIHNDG
jgi:putative transposase